MPKGERELLKDRLIRLEERNSEIKDSVSENDIREFRNNEIAISNIKSTIGTYKSTIEMRKAMACTMTQYGSIDNMFEHFGLGTRRGRWEQVRFMLTKGDESVELNGITAVSKYLCVTEMAIKRALNLTDICKGWKMTITGRI